MVAAVEEDLAEFLAAPPADRPALIGKLVEKHGAERIEAWKRFRNPEFRDLFLALLAEDDWHVKHRALLALEYGGDAGTIDAAWPLLAHPHRRLREKAAITLVKLWDGRKPPGDWPRLVAREEDFHVRQCLAALARRMEGTLPVVRVRREETATGRGGVVSAPYIDRMDPAEEPPAANRNHAPPATRWTTPLLGWGEEEVDAALLPRVPYAGACLDGAGLYAAADGVVRAVRTGGDAGTVIVVEHLLPRRETVTAVYRHGGDTVFVEPGERVATGQLLGTIGLGFSAENGGGFAHLDYRIAGRDPQAFLALWMDRTAPLLPTLRPLHASLRSAVREAEKEEIGRAHALATKARDEAEPGGEAHADAVYLLGLLTTAPKAGLERARRLRGAGYPRDALEGLETLATRCRGGPGAEALEGEIAAWRKDPLLQKAVKGEEKVDAAERRAEKTRDLWRRLLDEYGDTCLRARIEEQLR
jgi:murein DD-endopeptidase MepM/ murein hydrolase activator NlpD